MSTTSDPTTEGQSAAPEAGSPADAEAQADGHATGESRDPFSRWVGHPLFWIAVLVAVCIVPVYRVITTEPPRELPEFGKVPEFHLTSQHGEDFGTDQLTGRVWVADFIFTRCPGICPTLTARMRELQVRGRHLGEAMHLVSFSVDPAYDTPEVLTEYAAKHKANPRNWTFLTGQYEALKEAIVDGMSITMGMEGDGSDPYKIFHGNHFVLVDGQRQIRGYYDTSEDDGLDRLLRDAALLLNTVPLQQPSA